MKTAWVVLVMMMLMEARAGEAVARKVMGDVQIRPGVAEQWSACNPGAAIAMNATIKVGKGSSCVLDVDGTTIGIPAETIVDVSDIRKLTKEELMLKLAMENVRSSSYEWKNNELNITRTTVTHGDDKSARRTLTDNDLSEGLLRMNGTKVLFENAFYSTCALRTKEILRRHPQLAGIFEYRYRLAGALESSGLAREALNEYKAISMMESLSPGQKEEVSGKVAALADTP